MEVDLSKIRYREQFEALCGQLLVVMHPKAKALRGSDEGLDTFLGDFNGAVKCWQFKHFPSLGSGQKTQVKNSLKRAVTQHNVKEWTLCLPILLSKKEHRWFQTLQEDYPNVKLDYWNRNKLVTLIQKYEQVRNQFFPESEEMNKVLKEIKKIGVVNQYYLPKTRGAQLSAFKLKLIGIDVESFIETLKETFPKDKRVGFSKFIKIQSGFYKTKFIQKHGTHYLDIYTDEDENPFRLLFPKMKNVELWLQQEKSIVPTICLSIFTSDKQIKQFFMKIIKEAIPKELILKEVNFNKYIKRLVTKRFPHAIDTIALSSTLVEKIRNDALNQDVDVSIKDHIIHSKEGGLPKTKFMEQALKLVKRINKDNKESDIAFFRAKQTSNALITKTVTLELHNDGRIRIFYKAGEDKKKMKIALNEFINKIINNKL